MPDMDLSTLLGGTPQPQPAAPAAPVPAAPVPAPAVPGTAVPGTAVPGTAVPGTAAPAAPVPATPVAPAAPAAPVDLGGGNRLDQLMHNMRTASIGGGMVPKIPLGAGWYLLKSGNYKVTDVSKDPLTSFSLICIKAIRDIDGLTPGTTGYTGPVVGQEYSMALWQSGLYAMSNNLRALGACMGWSPEVVKAKQKGTNEECMQVLHLLAALTCIGLDGNPTGQVCGFSGSVMVEISGKVKNVDVLDDNKQPTLRQDGTKNTKSYENRYWDKKVYFKDVLAAGIPVEVLVAAFGSEQAIKDAQISEQKLAAL